MSGAPIAPGGDVTRARVVWRDAGVDVTVCPVLLLTPEVNEWFEWFERTHELRVHGFGPALWSRVTLPGAGGVEDQDAVTLSALDFIRDETNGLNLQERTGRSTRRPAQDKRRAKRRRDRGSE